MKRPTFSSLAPYLSPSDRTALRALVAMRHWCYDAANIIRDGSPDHKGAVMTIVQKLTEVAMLMAQLERAVPEIRQFRSGDSPGKKTKIGNDLRLLVLERDGFMCRRCGQKDGQDGPLHIDHVVPEASGGPTCLTNLQALCKACNTQKATLPVSDWLRYCQPEDAVGMHGQAVREARYRNGY